MGNMQARPTARTGGRFDLSATPTRASAAPAEARLFRAYGVLDVGQSGLMRAFGREAPCACGGTLTLLAGEDIEGSVIRHNATELHQAWRTWFVARNG